MEFEMKDGKALYRGLSLFDTIKNAYSGNVLCSEDDKVEMLKPLISEAQLTGIRQRIIRGFCFACNSFKRIVFRTEQCRRFEQIGELNNDIPCF